MAKNKTKTLKPTIASDKSQEGVVPSWIISSHHIQNLSHPQLQK
jgi:ribosomal protein L39E